MKITPKNWADFQHYKDRDPPWIKLHKKLLDDYEFQSLPVASRALAPMLWLLASEDKDGVIDANEVKLAFRFRMTVGELTDALMPLIQANFFSVERYASETLAPCKRDAMPEAEAQVQSQEQAKKIARSADADEITPAFDAYNAVAEETGWPKAQALTGKRRAALKARLGEVGGLEGWRTAMARARGSPFLCGESGRDRAHEKWTPDIDFFLQQSSFVKLMEGKYDDRTPAAGDRNSDFLRGVGSALDDLGAVNH